MIQTKHSALCLGLAVALLATGCNADEKKAQARYDAAKSLYEQQKYDAAKKEIDSIRVLYPKELKVLRAGLSLMRQVELSESERNIAFCDSLLPIKQEEFEKLKKNFKYEKDSAYNEIGNYVSKQQTIEHNILRCYLRSGVTEKGEMYLASVFFGTRPINHTGIRLNTPDDEFVLSPTIPYDGGLNYHFEDLGHTTEVVTYQGEQCAELANFIYNNKDKRIRMEYKGGKPYVIYIAEADKKAIAATFEFAAVLSDIEIMRKTKDKSIKKIAYLKKKLENQQ